MDLDVAHRVNARISLFSNITHYFSRREELPATGERNILNVATNTVRAGIDIDWGRLSGRVAARYVQGRQDQDFNMAGSPVVDYPKLAEYVAGKGMKQGPMTAHWLLKALAEGAILMKSR